jgi:polyisoprenoid-binding protein YceI
MKLLITFCVLALPLWSYANTHIKLGEGKTEFLATGNPGFLKIHAKGKAPQGSFEITDGKLNGEATVDLNSLDTGMSLRNQHMKEKYLETSKYPKAKLTIKNYQMPQGWKIASPELNSIKVPALITIHGEQKPVEVDLTLSEGAEMNAEFGLKISDFKIGVPSFMGVTVADKVEVKITSQIEPVTNKAI